MKISNEQKIAIKTILQEAGDILLSYMEREDGYLAEKKADGSLLTEADLASNQHIGDGLKELFKEHNIRSEEEDIQFISETTPTWLFDPLDGTSMFARGDKEFAILLSFIVNNEVTAGYMYFPAYERLLESYSGEGCKENGTLITLTPPVTSPKDNSIYFRGGEDLKEPVLLKKHLDSQQAVYKLLTNELSSIVLSMDKLGDWDIAAPSLILKESGLIVTDNNNALISFSSKPYDSTAKSCDYFIASNSPEAHKVALQLVSN